MKIRNIYHVFVVLFVCACTGLNGWFFGQVGGDFGGIIGVVTGVIAGVLFMIGFYNTKDITNKRLKSAMKLGAIYGAISGFLVHVPNIIMYYILGMEGVFNIVSAAGPVVGPIVGLVTGGGLGLILGFFLSFFRMESGDGPIHTV